MEMEIHRSSGFPAKPASPPQQLSPERTTHPTVLCPVAQVGHLEVALDISVARPRQSPNLTDFTSK